MKNFYSTLLFVSSAFGLVAQNLVGNSGFETYSSLPNSASDWAFCSGWNNVNLNPGTWPYATPDYFHTSGTGGGSSPNTAFGTCLPHTGNAFIGLYSRHASQTNSRDYMSRQLNSPLVVGQTYTISFWMTSGSGNYYYGSSCSGMGIQLTMSPLTQTQHEHTGGVPQAQVPGAPWIPNWTFYSFTYVATSAFQYVTVGNFYSDAATTVVSQTGSANFPAGVYYFIDDITVETISALPVELLYFDLIDFGDDVHLAWETNVEINNDYFEVERSLDLESWEVVARQKGAGNSSSPLKYGTIDSNPPSGTVYYRLKQIDFDGKESISELKSIRRFAEGVMNLYPNPAQDYLMIEARDAAEAQLEITDMFGRDVTTLVEVNTLNNKDLIRLGLQHLSAGTYTISLNGNQERFVKD